MDEVGRADRANFAAAKEAGHRHLLAQGVADDRDVGVTLAKEAFAADRYT